MSDAADLRQLWVELVFYIDCFCNWLAITSKKVKVFYIDGFCSWLAITSKEVKAPMILPLSKNVEAQKIL
jgi:hypothetical protein